MKMGVRIALCSSEWNYEVIKNATEGIQRFLNTHPDVQVVTFRELGKFGTREPLKGDNEIFALPQPEAFDGFVIQGNQVWTQTLRTEYVKHLRAAGVPVVSINYAIEGSTYIGTDNVGAVREMTAHLIKQVRQQSDEAFDIAFVRGLSRSLEARDRERGFREACDAAGIAEYNIQMYDGSWAAEDGAIAAGKMLEHPEKLPRILICANDDLAGAAAKVLMKAGVRIPDDMIVAGFDNLDIARMFHPRLISVERDYTGTIETALETMYQIIVTGKQPDCVFSPYRIMYCDHLSDGTELSKASAQQLQQEILLLNQRNITARGEERQRYYVQDQIEPAFLAAGSLSEIMDVFERFMGLFGDSNSYIAINTNYRYGNENAGEIKHYSDKMALMAVVSREGRKHLVNPVTHCYAVFDKAQILPEEIVRGKRHLDVFPLHYQETCIGYMVMSVGDDVVDYACLESVSMLMVNAIENARTKSLLQKANDRLAEMYLRDSLTGLYNRFGLDSKGKDYYRKLRGSHEIAFWFADMDNMKGINDRFGHKAGDAAIASLGHAIKKVADTYGLFAMRYGGDEFLIFGAEDPEHIRTEMQLEIDRIRLPKDVLENIEDSSIEWGGEAYCSHTARFREDGSLILAASIGVFTIGKDVIVPLEQCIATADGKMYEEKLRRKGSKKTHA